MSPVHTGALPPYETPRISDRRRRGEAAPPGGLDPLAALALAVRQKV